MDRLNVMLIKSFQFFLGKLARDVMPANAAAWHMNREFARHKLSFLRFIHARPYLALWVIVEYIWEEKDGQWGNFAFFPLQRTIGQREASAIFILNKAEKEARLAMRGQEEEDFEEFVMRETEAAIEGGIIDDNTGLPFELEGTAKEEEE